MFERLPKALQPQTIADGLGGFLNDLAMAAMGGGALYFAAPGSGAGAGEPRQPSRRQAGKADAIARAYRELDIPQEKLVVLIPADLFIDAAGPLPPELLMSSSWREVPRAGDETRPYFHRFFTADAGDSTYRLRWHTPTPLSVWSETLPTMSMEMRWRWFVRLPAARPHHVLLRNYGSLTEQNRADLEAQAERLGPLQNILSRVGNHAWITMSAYRSLTPFDPRLQWVRDLRDLAHFPGHPEGYEIPPAARPRGK